MHSSHAALQEQLAALEAENGDLASRLDSVTAQAEESDAKLVSLKVCALLLGQLCSRPCESAQIIDSLH
jgi:hypothetical protein